eukprot:CAMPEP_0172356790 /NCGR_PEP_ID=MMETSP1060-20121228/1176_1 /TAXON_ID=37318 /ORGANISM="Pseudo-nitzschia pungens, Strain cf. cingulata" /LENGTH=83 /DNA_ID=CAMNT_0013077117 /DNA_START=8 /DNA_END=256 /DNA_ORIENTATION=-
MAATENSNQQPKSIRYSPFTPLSMRSNWLNPILQLDNRRDAMVDRNLCALWIQCSEDGTYEGVTSDNPDADPPGWGPLGPPDP